MSTCYELRWDAFLSDLVFTRRLLSARGCESSTCVYVPGYSWPLAALAQRKLPEYCSVECLGTAPMLICRRGKAQRSCARITHAGKLTLPLHKAGTKKLVAKRQISCRGRYKRPEGPVSFPLPYSTEFSHTDHSLFALPHFLLIPAHHPSSQRPYFYRPPPKWHPKPLRNV